MSERLDNYSTAVYGIMRSRHLATGLAILAAGASVEQAIIMPTALAQDTQVTTTETKTSTSTSDISVTGETNVGVTPESDQNEAPSDSSIENPAGERRHYSLNMHDYNKVLSSRGCGILALSTAISFQRQQKTNPNKVWDRVDNVFTKDGVIKKGEYMRFAAPQAAKHYGLKSHQSDLDHVIKNIGNGASVIMLASAAADGIITRSSHYFESDEVRYVKKDGKMVGQIHIHDPNQKPGRKFNNSWRTIKWLKDHNTLKHTWVIEKQ